MKTAFKTFVHSIKSFGTRSIYMRLLYFFILLLLLCNVMVSVVVYSRSSGFMINEIKSAHLTLLGQAGAEIDRFHSELRDITVQISMNQNLRRALYYTEETTPTKMLVYSDVINYLHELATSHSNIRNIWIYLPNADTVLSLYGKHTVETYLKSVHSYDDIQPYLNAMKDYVQFAPLNAGNIDGTRMITYASSLPVNDLNHYGTVFVDIDEGTYRDFMRVQSSDDPACLFLRSPQGEYLVDYTQGYNSEEIAMFKNWLSENSLSDDVFEAKLADSTYTFAATTTRNSGYSLVSVIPNSVVAKKVSGIRYIVVSGFLASLALGLGLTIFAVVRLYSPIHRVVEYINLTGRWRQEDQQGKNELLLISSFIETLYDQNIQIRSRLDSTRHIIAKKYLVDIIEAKKPANPAQLAYARDNAGLNHRLFQILVCAPDSENPLERMRLNPEFLEKMIVQLRNAKASAPQDISIFFVVIKGFIGCILNFEDEMSHPEFPFEFAHQIINELESCFGFGCSIGIGRAYDLQDLSHSYVEALFALKSAFNQSDSTVTHIDEASNVSPSLFEYSLDEEKHIINVLKSGNYEETRALIVQVLERNQRITVSDEMMDNLLNALAGTCIRALYEGSLSVEAVAGAGFNIYSELQSHEAYEEKLGVLLDFLRTITRSFEGAKSNHNQNIYEDVIKYVESNYADDISLQLLGSHLGLSASRISYVFKQVSGKHFVDYVNLLRIDKAKELMDSTKLPISSICQMVGFRTPNNFNRVFRKYEGITPGEYRSQNN